MLLIVMQALQERIMVLTDQVTKSEEELTATKEELTKCNESTKDAENTKLKVLERERAMDAELEVLPAFLDEIIDFSCAGVLIPRIDNYSVMPTSFCLGTVHP